MTSRALRLAVAAVRGWTSVYTAGLSLEIAARRRAEIASDLWELQHDPAHSADVSPATHVLARLFFGVGHDLLWRAEQVMVPAEFTFQRIARITATAAFLLAGLWVVPLWSGNKPHQHCITAQQADLVRLNPSAKRALLLEHHDESFSAKACRP